MQSLFIDESGYNGPDLLNEDQPVFVLGGIAIDEASARALKEKYFPECGGDELKHSKLYSDEDKTDRLLGLIRECFETRYVIACIIEKKYLACEIFVFDIVSRFRHDIQFGSDRFRNLVYSLRTVSRESALGQEFDNLLSQYVRTVSKILRKKDASDEIIKKEYASLYAVMRGLRDPMLVRLCAPAVDRDDDFALELKSSILSGSAQGALFGVITHAENDIGQDYDVIFDKSPALSEFRQVIENLKTCSATSVHVSRETKLDLPLKRLKAMREVDSKESVGVQLADLIAGSAARLGLIAFGGTPKTKHDNYDNSICELWSRYPRSQLYKPTFDNNGFDISEDAARVVMAAAWGGR